MVQVDRGFWHQPQGQGRPGKASRGRTGHFPRVFMGEHEGRWCGMEVPNAEADKREGGKEKESGDRWGEAS